MIHFNQYPPQKPEDVELTREFRNDLTNGTIEAEEIHAYGVAIGRVVAANFEDKSRSNLVGTMLHLTEGLPEWVAPNLSNWINVGFGEEDLSLREVARRV
jgi:hypothetical protein